MTLYIRCVLPCHSCPCTHGSSSFLSLCRLLFIQKILRYHIIFIVSYLLSKICHSAEVAWTLAWRRGCTVVSILTSGYSFMCMSGWVGEWVGSCVLQYSNIFVVCSFMRSQFIKPHKICAHARARASTEPIRVYLIYRNFFLCFQCLLRV